MDFRVFLSVFGTTLYLPIAAIFLVDIICLTLLLFDLDASRLADSHYLPPTSDCLLLLKFLLLIRVSFFRLLECGVPLWCLSDVVSEFYLFYFLSRVIFLRAYRGCCYCIITELFVKVWTLLFKFSVLFLPLRIKCFWVWLAFVLKLSFWLY